MSETLTNALSGLPNRPRVHELAKRAGLSSKEITAALAADGVEVKSAASSVDQNAAIAVLNRLLGAAESSPPPSEPPVEPAAEPVVFEDPAGVTEDPAGLDLLFLPPSDSASSAPDQGSTNDKISLPDKSGDKPKRTRRPSRAKTSVPDTAGTQSGFDAFTVDLSAPALTAASETPAEIGDDVGPVSETATQSRDASAAEGTPKTTRRRRGRAAKAEPDLTDADQAVAAGAESSRLADGSTASADGGVVDLVTADDVANVELLSPDTEDAGESDESAAGRRRRRRGRRGRGRVGADLVGESDSESETDDLAAIIIDSIENTAGDLPGDESAERSGDESGEALEESSQPATRRVRRRRRRSGGEETGPEDDTDNTVVHVREPRMSEAARAAEAPRSNEVQGVRGSTRLEAKRQRRKDSRTSSRRPQILTEAEFLARRESVERVMAVRQRGDLAQVALLEDGVLVEHFVSRAGSESLMGNIYFGKVQNVLPSMEAAFIDIGRGRNAVLYAGEVNWDAAGLAGKARRIETALNSGDALLVQVSKDPVGHKGARLTTQISLPGRFLVYVPGGGATGISRKLPDTERKRLKSILDRIVPEDAGVIIRTAAEGVAEDELARDVERLKTQWEEISAKSATKANAPTLLSSEPDTLIKVVRDLFNSDITSLVLDGDLAYEPVAEYVQSVAPELADRVSRYDGPNDVFSAYRIDEQIAKALERKVHLPSGGSLVIDRTEAMTVVDVNTGKYTGSGGNLEETVTKNNLEAAEEIVRQLRLRDIGGIIVVDFIDMVLESNRELVLRRLTECLGRDRTRHQVAEVTSLGLVQMTRKKMGTGLVEAFSSPCPHCGGRGIVLHDVPVDPGAGEPAGDSDDDRRGDRSRRTRGRQPAVSARIEPALDRVIVAPAVRPPDPRGPRPPMSGSASRQADVPSLETPSAESMPSPAIDAVNSTPPDTSAVVSEATVVADPAPERQISGGRGRSRSQEGAPISREASDAVSAVFAALDAQAAAQAAEAPVDQTAGESAAGRPDGVLSDSAPRTGRRRGRRSAGRPAGAPDGSRGSAVDGTAAEGGLPSNGSDPSDTQPASNGSDPSDAGPASNGSDPSDAGPASNGSDPSDTPPASNGSNSSNGSAGNSPSNGSASSDAAAAALPLGQPAANGAADQPVRADSGSAGIATDGTAGGGSHRSPAESSSPTTEPRASTPASDGSWVVEALESEAAPPTRPAPRRRRAASRPAGPAAAPVGVSE